MIAACVEADVAVRDPDIAALQNRAASLKRQRRYEDALNAYEAVLALEGGNLHALNECGGLHVWLGRPAAAVACYDRALAIAPRTVVLHINKGTAQVALNRLADGLASFEAALAIDPESAEGHYDASLVRLRLGDFRNGWCEYEWRWRKGTGRPDIGAPLWLGEETLLDKTILLLAEQGFGDTINFMRYAPLVAARGATVIFGVQSQLKTIAATVPGVALALGAGEPVPSVDFYCPLLSLPHAFKTELATVPANIPYVRPDSERLAKWQDRLAANGRLRVGICWAGSNIHLNDRNRSIPLERFATILVSGIDFISLQRDVAPPEAAILSAHGVQQIGQEFSDFADTAAVVSMLDLVISVDTSVAHLAGAMAKAAAVLIPFAPDFRWLLDRTDSPWYPTLRLFRQAAIGDWSGPLNRLRHELAAVAAKRG
ncbi:MAG TPA: tetratricopeptide repeat protein [Xanthobacteraceae bacterium]